MPETIMAHSQSSGAAWRWLASPVLLVTLAACGGGSNDGPPPRQVLVVMLDAARSDRMGCYGYERDTTPNIDELAETGAVFLRNYTQGTNTRKALPTMLFSRYFCIPVFPFSADEPLTRPEDLFRVLDDEAISMPRVFENAGFHTAGITAHTWTKSTTLFAREFQEWNDLAAQMEDDTAGYPEAEVAVDFAIDWIEEHEDDDFFLYLHLMDTHFPHMFGDDARHFLGKDKPETNRFNRNGFVQNFDVPLKPEEMDYLNALYDGSMRYTDRHLGRLFDALEGGPLLEHGLLAIVADHGEGLLERPGVFEHGGPWFEPVARIPFVLAGKERVPPGRHEYFTGLIDLMPTLMACMGVELPPGKAMDGLDLSPYLAPGSVPERDYMAHDGGIIRGSLKALYGKDAAYVLGEKRPEEDVRVRGRLFDLLEDPLELESVRGENRDVWVEMVRLYRDALGPSYDRYVASTTNEPPRREFAIGAWSFQTVNRTEVTEVPRNADEAVAAVAGANGWFLCDEWPNPYLLGAGHPEPLAVRVDLPDGEYFVHFNVAGRADFYLNVEKGDPQGEPVSLDAAPDAGPIDPPKFLRTFMPTKELSLPEPVHVKDQRFRVMIDVPEDSSGVVVTSIGFKPTDLEEEAYTSEELRRLQELGYL